MSVRWLVVACVLLLPALAAAQSESPAELTDVAVVERESGTAEVWVRLSRAVKYNSELMDSPWRLVVDFDDTAFRWTARPGTPPADPVREVRGSQFKKGVSRLVVELRRKVAYTIEQDREGLRIVLRAGDVAATPPAPRPPTAEVKPSPSLPVPAKPSTRPLPAEVPPAPRPLPTRPMVYGIIRLDERAHAYIFDPQTRQVRRYAEGDTLGDAVVEKISDRHVVLKTPTGRVELRVDETKPDAAPAPAPRPR